MNIFEHNYGRLDQWTGMTVYCSETEEASDWKHAAAVLEDVQCGPVGFATKGSSTLKDF